MGGFLLLKKDSENTDLLALEKKYEKSINTFNSKGLKLNKKLSRADFLLFVYKKLVLETDNLLEINEQDFIVSTGTCIYKGRVGREALKDLYNDFVSNLLNPKELLGNYCVIIFHSGKLEIFRDYQNFYGVYTSEDHAVMSSSFLALTQSLDELKVSKHELYEYLLNGFFPADDTLIKGIKKLDSKFVHQIHPTPQKYPQLIYKVDLPKDERLGELVDEVAEKHIEIFDNIKTAFHGKITTAVSGGYDTRLLLALIRKVGINPNLYVYGKEQSTDVQIAKYIAEKEQLKVQHINKNNIDRVELNDYEEFIKKQFLFYDGLGNAGIFNNGSDISTRMERAAHSVVQLNGAGGEIYREIWNLPNRKVSLHQFFKSKYDIYDYSFLSKDFSKKNYVLKTVQKIKNILNKDTDVITRIELEKLYPYYRHLLAEMNNSINNQIQYTYLPFSEQRLVIPSFDIPLEYKYYGKFEAELIKKLDPKLAKYPSQYGINFYDEISFSRKLKDNLKSQIPINVRPLLRMIRDKNKNMPYYLSKDYLEQIFNVQKLYIAEYVDISKIKNPKILSRALSVELILQNRY